MQGHTKIIEHVTNDTLITPSTNNETTSPICNEISTFNSSIGKCTYSTLIINNNPKSCYRGHTYDANTNKCTYNATCPSNYILVNNTCMSNDSSLARLSMTPQQVRSIRDQS